MDSEEISFNDDEVSFRVTNTQLDSDSRQVNNRQNLTDGCSPNNRGGSGSSRNQNTGPEEASSSRG